MPLLLRTALRTSKNSVDRRGHCSTAWQQRIRPLHLQKPKPSCNSSSLPFPNCTRVGCAQTIFATGWPGQETSPKSKVRMIWACGCVRLTMRLMSSWGSLNSTAVCGSKDGKTGGKTGDVTDGWPCRENNTNGLYEYMALYPEIQRQWLCWDTSLYIRAQRRRISSLIRTASSGWALYKPCYTHDGQATGDLPCERLQALG